MSISYDAMRDPTISKFLEGEAILFVCGSLPEEQRWPFELLLRCDENLRAYTASLIEVTAPLSLARPPLAPSPDLKNRVLDLTKNVAQEEPEPLVLSTPEGLVEWVNPAFSELCGYSLEELRGKKPGRVLQGEKTDRETASRLRQAVRQASACCETILNYHKSGRPYWVEIAITPVLDDTKSSVCLIAQARERTDIPLP